MTHLQACLLWHILLSSIALHGNGFRFMWFVWRSKFCIQNHIIQLVCFLQEVNFGTTQEAIDHTVLKLLLSRIVHRCFIALSSQWLMTVSWSPHSLPCVHFPSLLYGLLSASAFSQIPSPPECLTNCFWPILYFPLVMLPSIYSTCKCFALFLIIELILLFVIKVSHRLSNTNTLSLHEHLNHPWLYMIVEGCFIFWHPSPFHPLYIIMVKGKCILKSHRRYQCLLDRFQLPFLPCCHMFCAPQMHSVSLIDLLFHFRQLPTVSLQHHCPPPRYHHAAFYLRNWPIPSHLFTTGEVAQSPGDPKESSL